MNLRNLNPIVYLLLAGIASTMAGCVFIVCAAVALWLYVYQGNSWPLYAQLMLVVGGSLVSSGVFIGLMLKTHHLWRSVHNDSLA